MVEVAERNLHVAELVLKGGRAASVGAGVVLAGGPGLLHAGRVMQGLGLVVSVTGPIPGVHAMLPATLNGVTPDPRVGHLVHVRYAVVHHEEPQSTIN